ncbi:MAG: hypothetical protein LBT81_02270 [Helicobacteraceae bacterium]|jgi:hypothetical protein|nr:hypothetical protein [Helicobacteraceae bacterium]
MEIAIPKSITANDRITIPLAFDALKSPIEGYGATLVIRKGIQKVEAASIEIEPERWAFSFDLAIKASGTGEYQAVLVDPFGARNTFAFGYVEIQKDLFTMDTRNFRTLGDLLADAESAITAITRGNQEYRIDGMLYQKATLASLYIWRDKLKAEISVKGADYTEGGEINAVRVVQSSVALGNY